MNNPVIQRMMEKFFDQRFKDLQSSGKTSDKQMVINHKSDANGKVQVDKNSGSQVNREVNETNVKSPSDTTIYAPALRKKLTPNREEQSNFVVRS